MEIMKLLLKFTSYLRVKVETKDVTCWMGRYGTNGGNNNSLIRTEKCIPRKS